MNRIDCCYCKAYSTGYGHGIGKGIGNAMSGYSGKGFNKKVLLGYEKMVGEQDAHQAEDWILYLIDKLIVRNKYEQDRLLVL